MDASPLVSAVIPAFNAESFIAEAVSSVLAQTYRPVECIVVDDGSTDGTAEVVRSFGSEVRLVTQPNKGVANARNSGAAVANGAFLAFLDADDVWMPNKLEKQMILLEDNSSLGLVYSGVLEVDEALRPIGQVEPAPPGSALRNTLLLEQPWITAACSTGVLPIQSFHAVKGFDEQLSTSADCDFVCRLACRYAIACVPEPLTLYRRHSSQMSADIGLMEHDMLLVFDKLFGDEALPSPVRSLHGRALANLYFTLAASSRRTSSPTRSMRHLLRAWHYDPRRAAQLLWRSVGRRRRGRRTNPVLAP